MKKILLLIIAVFIICISVYTITCYDNQRQIEYDVQLKDTTKEILSELEIIDRDKLNSDTPVLTYDFFAILEKMRYGKLNNQALSYWYYGDTLASMDYLEDSKKITLLSLTLYNEGNVIIDYSEIPDLNLQKEITNSQAILYIVRMVADTDSCSDVSLNYYPIDTDIKKVYKVAHKKGLIKSKNSLSSDDFLTYSNLSDILHKALFTEYNVGCESGIEIVRLYDSLVNKKNNKEYEENKEEIQYEEVKLPATVTVNDDLSIEWTLPEEYNFIKDEDYSTKVIGIFSSFRSEIKSTDMVQYLIAHMDNLKPSIRCEYINYDENKRYYFDIDISNINIKVTGNEIKPGKYIRFSESWCAKELTLKEPGFFNKDFYYILKSRDNRYRKQEYNITDYECFKVEKDGNTFICPADVSFGVMYLNDIKIMEVKVTGNYKKGFNLLVTPESKEPFTIIESYDKN